MQAMTMQAITNVGHSYVRSHAPSGLLAPVVADVSLMHSENSIADAGLTELSTALKVNQAITNLNLSCKLLRNSGG